MSSNESTEEPSALEKKIIRQMEYYFGDINLPRDRFLQEQVKEAEDGWVPLETMVKFNRLKELSDNFEVIVKAIKKSKADLLQVSEDNEKVRRNPEKPLPENTAERRQEMTEKTVYVKPFPLEVTLDKLMEYFEEYGTVENLFMRKDIKRKFKGSVFVTFEKQDDANKFVKEETVKYEETELIRKLKKDYYTMKENEKKQRKADQQKKIEELEKKKGEDDRERVKKQLTEGAVLHIKGLGKDIQREDIKNFLQDHGNVIWINFDKGDEEAFVRFGEKDMAKDVLEKVKKENDGKFIFNEAELESRVLEGEEEVDHWVKIFQEMAERRDQKKRKFGNKGGQGRFGGGRKGFKGKKSRAYKKKDDSDDEDVDGGDDDDADEPPAKQAKLE